MPVANDALGHSFGVPPVNKRYSKVDLNDREKLRVQPSVSWEEPDQLKTDPVPREELAEEAIAVKDRIQGMIDNYKNIIKAGEMMQGLLGEKLKNRTVTVDPRRDPRVRDAVRRLFGRNSATITYEMFKAALELRSELIEEEREKTYGTRTPGDRPGTDSRTGS